MPCKPALPEVEVDEFVVTLDPFGPVAPGVCPDPDALAADAEESDDKEADTDDTEDAEDAEDMDAAIESANVVSTMTSVPVHFKHEHWALTNGGESRLGNSTFNRSRSFCNLEIE